MPVTPSYPGVYIEEIPSGVRTITGVATSVAAFLGRTQRGPANVPVLINSFADFERQFGGMWADGPMTYAVRDFFLNGGAQAVIVRLFSPWYTSDTTRDEAIDAAQSVADAATGGSAAEAAESARTEADDTANEDEPRHSAADAVATAAEREAARSGATPESVQAAAQAAVGHFRYAPLTVGDLSFQAATPGEWGNDLRATVDPDVSDEAAEQYGMDAADLFNLTITDVGTGTSETFANVSLVEGPRRVDRVLASQSNLARWAGAFPDADELPEIPEEETSDAITQLEEELADARTALRQAKNAGDQDAIDDAQEAVDEAEAALSEGKAEVAVTDGMGLGAADYSGSRDDKTGMYGLEDADIFNLLCIPPDTHNGDTPPAVYQEALAYCVERRAMLIVDPQAAWGANEATAVSAPLSGLDDLGLSGTAARNAALYYPRIIQADPLRDGQFGTFVPCGVVAGVMARTDVERGVWKAPAGIDAALNAVQGLQINLTDLQNGTLNQRGINCLRAFPVYGRVVWGARTLRGADQLADEYKYVPVRRLALFLEESLYRGTKWVVFEPNDEPLWAQIRLNVGAFMHNLYRQGAFQGASPREAYFVKCDGETTTQNDINLGIVNIVVGFAPLKPAEFVIIKFQQMAGQIET